MGGRLNAQMVPERLPDASTLQKLQDSFLPKTAADEVNHPAYQYEAFNKPQAPYSQWKNLPEAFDKRGESNKTFQNADGSFTAVTTAGETHYKKSGEWMTILNRFETTSFYGYEYVAPYNNFMLGVGHSGIDVLSFDGKVFRTWGELMIDGKVTGYGTPVLSANDKLEFQAVLPGIDAIIDYKSTGYEVSYRLAGPHVVTITDSFSVSETIILPEGATYKRDGNDVEFYDSGGKFLFRYGKILAVDAKGENTHGTLQLEQTNNAVRITASISGAWLTDPLRAWPIVFDPTVTTVNPNNTSQHTGTVEEDGGCSFGGDNDYDDEMRIGFDDGTVDNDFYNAFARFNIASIPDNACISNATTSFYQQGWKDDDCGGGFGCGFCSTNDALTFYYQALDPSGFIPTTTNCTDIYNNINSTSTWYQQWNVFGGALDYNETINNAWKPFTFNVSSRVQSLLSQDFVIFSFDNSTASHSDCAAISDDEWLTWSGRSSGNRPQLIVTYVVPAFGVTASTNLASLCAGGSFTLSAGATNATDVTSWSWTGPGGFSSTSQSVTRSSATTAMSGTYTVTVSTGCGSSATATAVVTVNALPNNNNCANASGITTGATSYSTTCATNDGPAIECSSGVHNNIWYRYVATASGTLAVGTCNASTNYDTRLSIYSSSTGDCSSLTYMDCDDDDDLDLTSYCGSGNANYSYTTVPVCSGGVYYISLGGYNGQTGGGVITLTLTALPTLTASHGYRSCAGVNGFTTYKVAATGGFSSSYTYSQDGGPFNASNAFNVPNGNTNLYRVRDANGCISSNLSYTAPSTPTSLATSTTTCDPCSSDAENRLLWLKNGLTGVAQINDNGNNLGVINAKACVAGSPYLVPDGTVNGFTAAAQRSLEITFTQPSTPVRLIVPFTSTEVSNLASASVGSSSANDLVTGIGDLKVTRMEGIVHNCTWNTTGLTLRQNIIPSANPTVLSSPSVSFLTSGNSVYFFEGSVSNSPLPIELLDFTPTCKGNDVEINWTTATETNNDYFVIESSDNGTDWKQVCTIDGAGTVNAQRSYSCIDSDPFWGAEYRYYRLTQFDFNGEFETFSPKVVSCDGTPIPDVMLYPNPSSGLVNVLTTYENPTPIKLTVYDGLGRFVSAHTYTASSGIGTYELNLSNLQAGIYMIRIEGKESVTKRLVISR